MGKTRIKEKKLEKTRRQYKQGKTKQKKIGKDEKR